MDTKGSGGALVDLLDRVRALPKAREQEFPEGTRRPGIFALLFWSAMVATCASPLLDLFGESQSFGLLPAVLAAGLLSAVWLALPWDPRASSLRKILAPAFLIAVFVLGHLTGPAWALAFYPIFFANGVFLFGFARGIAYAAAVVLPAGLVNLLGAYPGYLGVEGAAFVMALMVPVAVSVIGVCRLFIEAIQAREETRDLLQKLEAANAELQDYAARVGELAVSEERARMAREIHDSVGHHLTVINLQLENARRFREKRPREAWEEVSGAKELTLEALSEVRRSVRALKPLALESGGGAEALAALAESFQGSGFDVSFRIEGEGRGLPAEAELVLYRVMQEGLTNALRHSGAHRVFASLTLSEHEARLVVADNGVGAPEGGIEKGFGLSALSERAEALGGTLDARNRPERGFALEARLPIVRGRP